MQRLTAELWDGSAPASDIVSSCNTDELESACSTNQSESDELTQMHLPHDFDHDIADWPRLKRTWRGAFVDPVVERAYKYDVFLPTLGRSMGRVFALMLAFNAVSFASISLRAGDEDEYFYALSAHVVIAAMFFGLSMCFHSKRFCSVPMFLMEPTASALLIVLALFLRWHQLLTPSTACSSNATLMLRLSSFMVLSATYVPLTVPAFAAVAIVSIGIGAALDLHDPDAAGWCPLNLLNLCLAGVASTMCRYYLSDMSRAAWAFRRRVIEEQMRRKETLMEFERARAKRYRERKREQELVRKVEKIEEGKHARSRLIRCVMHDLRSPLLSILNVTKMLVRMDGATPLASEAVHSSIDALCACSTLMECIVSDMLDFERIDMGRLVLVHHPFTLARLLADTYATFEGLTEEKGVQLVHAVVEDTLVSAAFMGDKRRLQQCLNNGVSNALKFTDRGGRIQFRAWLGAPCDKADFARINIAIIDDGIGLSESEVRTLNLGRVFTQVGAGQMQGKGGTGLGISITQSILAMHNDSELSISSEGEGRGTTFQLALNLEYADPSAVPDEPTSPHAGVTKAEQQHVIRRVLRSHPESIRRAFANELAAHDEQEMLLQQDALAGAAATGTNDATDGSGADGVLSSSSAEVSAHMSRSSSTGDCGFELPSGFCCLHVEDDTFLQATMPHVTFIPVGARWETAENGEKAIEMVKARASEGLPPYDLIVMDNQMPRMNGAECVRLLRAGGHAGFIVGMTGDPIGSPERSEFEASGLSACVEKDSTGTDYVSSLIRALGRPHGQTSLPGRLRTSGGRTGTDPTGSSSSSADTSETTGGQSDP